MDKAEVIVGEVGTRMGDQHGNAILEGALVVHRYATGVQLQARSCLRRNAQALRPACDGAHLVQLVRTVMRHETDARSRLSTVEMNASTFNGFVK